MIATPRAVGVEIHRLHALLAQVTAGGAVGLNVAGGGDVVGGHRVAEQGEDARLVDVADMRRRIGDVLEEGRMLDIGRVGLPGIGIGLRHVNRLPLRVAGEHLGVFLVEHRGVHLHDRRADFRLARPDVLEVHRLAIGAGAQRLFGDIHPHAAGQRIGHHQRRRGQPVGFHQRVHAAFEVAVAGEHRGDGQVVGLDGCFDRLGQWPGVADAGGAAVADQIEAQRVEVAGQAGGVEVFGDHLGARRQRALDPGLALQAFLHGLFRQQAGGHHHAGVGGVGAGGDGGDHHRAVFQAVGLALVFIIDLASLLGAADGCAATAFIEQATFFLGRGFQLQADEFIEDLFDLR